MGSAKGDFRYHLLSIGVNRDANGSSARAAERDAFGVSWTFAQLGYWRAERNRCLTGSQASAAAIDASEVRGCAYARWTSKTCARPAGRRT